MLLSEIKREMYSGDANDVAAMPALHTVGQLASAMDAVDKRILVLSNPLFVRRAGQKDLSVLLDSHDAIVTELKRRGVEIDT